VSFRFAQILSKVLLFAALIAFGAFHFLPQAGETGERGWNVWGYFWELLLNPEGVDDALQGVILAAFLTTSVLIVASPFLGVVWLRSKLAWWICMVFSGIAAGSFWIGIVIYGTDDFGPGDWCLMAAPTLNFLGLLLAGTRVPRNPTIIDLPGKLSGMDPADEA